MLKYCWTLHYNLPWNDISSIIHLFNHSYCKLAMNVTYIYVNINKKWIVPSQIFLCCITLYAFGNKVKRILSTLPSFQDRMETDVSLLHECSLCFYNLFGFCSQLHGIRLCICCVFEPKLLTNQQDDVTNCVFGHVTRFKRTKFWAEIRKFKRS